MPICGRSLARALVVLALVCTAAVAFAEDAPKASAAGDDYLWHWSKTCPNPKWLGVTVVLNGRTVYTSAIPLCRLRRSEIQPDRTQSRLVFVLRGRNRSLFGEPAGTRIEGNLWEAGSESDAVILGISATQNRVLLNTLHFANLDSAAASEVAKGLVIRTYPRTSP